MQDFILPFSIVVDRCPNCRLVMSPGGSADLRFEVYEKVTHLSLRRPLLGREVEHLLNAPDELFGHTKIFPEGLIAAGRFRKVGVGI